VVCHHGRSPQAYVNQKLQIQLRFLMMSDITLETCWTINVLWNNKIPLLSCILLVTATSHSLEVQLNMCAGMISVQRRGIWNNCTKKTLIHITVYTKQSTFWAECESHTWTLKMLLTKMGWSAGRNRWIWYFPRNIATSITATAATTAAAT